MSRPGEDVLKLTSEAKSSPFQSCPSYLLFGQDLAAAQVTCKSQPRAVKID